ncbi:MAG: alpha/beta hydrolase, partial [Sphingopyxis terrae]
GLATRGPAKARFGPFAVVDGTTARMSGDVDGATPRQFAAMLAAFPGVRRLEMIDCPGSLDEEANLILARAIRRAGLETVVPSGGSVRSGAVELWLAGSTRRAAPDAEFGVHSWADEYGREAKDYPASDPVHAEYIGLYREMGMDDAHARAFYALTNATPFDQVRYLTRDDMARFVPLN